MTAATLTIADFLLARIGEDEASARAAIDASSESGRWWVDGPAEVSRKFWVYATGEKFKHEATAHHIARHDPARVLAECAAKRAIVARATDPVAHAGQGVERQWALRALASVYADHPDFDSRWAL